MRIGEQSYQVTDRPMAFVIISRGRDSLIRRERYEVWEMPSGGGGKMALRINKEVVAVLVHLCKGVSTSEPRLIVPQCVKSATLSLTRFKSSF